jgi:hypothetical protein
MGEEDTFIRHWSFTRATGHHLFITCPEEGLRQFKERLEGKDIDPAC